MEGLLSTGPTPSSLPNITKIYIFCTLFTNETKEVMRTFHSEILNFDGNLMGILVGILTGILTGILIGIFMRILMGILKRLS